MGRLLQDKVTIVTGAARGIGRAVTRAFAAEGATVFAVDIIAADLAEVMAELDAEGLTAHPLVADIARPDDVQRIATETLAASGRIDCLANVAGVITYRPIEELSLEEWDRILGINLRGTFLCTRAVVQTMKRQRTGSIINVSSRAGATGFAELSAYCAAKFGVEGLSRALALELAPFGIAVNTITPGTPVHTAMSEVTYTPDKRKIWQDPAVIAPAFVHLACQTSDGLNDQTINAWELTKQLRAQSGKARVSQGAAPEKWTPP